MRENKRWLLCAGIIVLGMIVYFSALHLKIKNHSQMAVSANVDYLIILGAKVNGTVPSLALQYRIDTAAEYMKNYTNTVAIASGGKGPGEDISEAEAIKARLIKHGVSEERILVEDQSTDTVENIRFSKQLLTDEWNSGLVVTNDFHIYRAKSIARDQGLELAGLPADTPAVAVVKSYGREYLAITKYYLVKYLNMDWL
ncbi:YdcF family protein [Bacillus sp. MRMR6]|uniref:YdcF family protein n=1 Tax=Bacillus sp. MRMR6 TaxID=1928617 RepID=UPI0009532777|nr:YdcF family protein [Bacillus sp. MRMR6]OLS36788.1 cytoplasmic protein [Bacillus sp. MRMR6]